MQGKKTQQGRSVRPMRKRLLVVSLVAGALILAFAAIVIVVSQHVVANSHLVSRDKINIEQDVQQRIRSIGLAGSVVYDETQDNGCKNQGGFLQIDYLCWITTRRYFRINGTVGQTLQNADTELKRLGYQWYPFSGESKDDFDSALKGDRVAILRYRNNRVPTIYLLLGYYNDTTHSSDPGITDLVNSGKLSVSPGELIYGISSDANYWSCSNKSLLEQPCSQPPSPVR